MNLNIILIPIYFALGNTLSFGNLLSFDHNSFIINGNALEDSIHTYKRIYVSDIEVCLHKKYDKKLEYKKIENVEYFWPKEGLLFTQAPTGEVVSVRIFIVSAKYDNKIKMSGFEGLFNMHGIYINSETTEAEIKDIMAKDNLLKAYNDRFNQRYRNLKDGKGPDDVIGFDFGDGWHQTQLIFDEKSHKVSLIDLFF